MGNRGANPEILFRPDDLTDEDAFRFLRGRGITVFVGPPETPSAAEYFLETPEKVGEFIRRFLVANERREKVMVS